MQETGNKNRLPRLVIRVDNGSLSFAAIDLTTEKQVIYEPYNTRNGISMAANMREAFKDSELLRRGFKRTKGMLSSPVMIVPIEEFDTEKEEDLYKYIFGDIDGEEVMHHVINELNAVALFSINKDLKLVLSDNFTELRVFPLLEPVWRYLHKRSFMGLRKKLYGYFHDGKMDVFSFRQNRFLFTNSFEASHTADIVYYLLNVWQQMAFTDKDELFLVGDVKDREELTNLISKYLQNVYFIKPTSEFNRSPITQINGIPFDLMTLFING